MSEIPEDIMRYAEKYADVLAGGHLTVQEVIAGAINAERKSAATVAYLVCASTRHVTLGEQARQAILKGAGE